MYNIRGNHGAIRIRSESIESWATLAGSETLVFLNAKTLPTYGLETETFSGLMNGISCTCNWYTTSIMVMGSGVKRELEYLLNNTVNLAGCGVLINDSFIEIIDFSGDSKRLFTWYNTPLNIVTPYGFQIKEYVDSEVDIELMTSSEPVWYGGYLIGVGERYLLPCLDTNITYRAYVTGTETDEKDYGDNPLHFTTTGNDVFVSGMDVLSGFEGPLYIDLFNAGYDTILNDLAASAVACCVSNESKLGFAYLQTVFMLHSLFRNDVKESVESNVQSLGTIVPWSL